MSGSERGGVSVLALVVVVLAGMVLVGLGRSGAAAVRSARAETAADAAALAAADALASGRSPADARADAAAAAADDGAALRSCECTGRHAEVVVSVGDATGRSRAEIDLPCGPARGAC